MGTVPPPWQHWQHSAGPGSRHQSVLSCFTVLEESWCVQPLGADGTQLRCLSVVE